MRTSILRISTLSALLSKPSSCNCLRFANNALSRLTVCSNRSAIASCRAATVPPAFAAMPLTFRLVALRFDAL